MFRFANSADNHTLSWGLEDAGTQKESEKVPKLRKQGGNQEKRKIRFYLVFESRKTLPFGCVRKIPQASHPAASRLQIILLHFSMPMPYHKVQQCAAFRSVLALQIRSNTNRQ